MKKLRNFGDYLIPILVVLLAVFASFSFLMPKIAAIFKLQKEVSQNKKNLASLVQKVNFLEGLNQTELTKKTDILLAALPAEKDVPRLLITFKTLASQTGVELEQIQVTPGELVSTENGQATSSTLPFLPFKIQAFGELKEIRNFLDKIEKTFPLMKIADVSLSGTQEDLFAATINLDAFFLPLPKGLGPAEKALPLLSLQEEETYQRLTSFEKVELPEGLPPVQSGKENLFSL